MPLRRGSGRAPGRSHHGLCDDKSLEKDELGCGQGFTSDGKSA